MNRAYALLASLILIATPMAGCLSGEDLEELVDDVLGCMDENAANYEENATAELVGNCIYMATTETFIEAMTDMGSIEDMLEESPKAGYSQSISSSEWNQDLGMQMDVEIEDIVMVNLENDSVYVHNSISIVALLQMEYTHVQVGEIVNVHYSIGGMMAQGEATSGSYQTRDATPNVLEVIAEQAGLFSEGDDDDGDEDDEGDLPEDAVITITISDDMETQTMTMEYTEDGTEITMTIHIDQNEDLMSMSMESDNGSATSSITYEVMWGDAIVIEVDETLPRTSIPVWLDFAGEDEFVCGTGETIPMDWVDDGYPDCEDGSDESDNHGDDDHDDHGDDDHDDHGDDGNHISWNSYYDGHCEWEGYSDATDAGEDSRWWCKISQDDEDWDTWWYYCEHHDSDWHCTDDFGQSEEFEHSADGDEWSGSEDGEDAHDDDTPPSPEDAMNMTDSDGDGYMSQEEFVTYWNNENPDAPIDSDQSFLTTEDVEDLIELCDYDTPSDLIDINEMQCFIDNLVGMMPDDENAPSLDDFFNHFDTDGDGHLTATEFIDANDISDDEQDGVHAMFDMYDNDESGGLDYYEFEPLYDMMVDEGDGDDPSADEVFEWMNTDGDGQVTPSEWADFSNSTGDIIDEDNFNGLVYTMDMYDYDDSDGLDIYEFTEMWDEIMSDEDDDGDDSDDDSDGMERNDATGFVAENQTLNAPISDFEVHFLSDCEEEYDEEEDQMIQPDLSTCTNEFSIPLTGGEMEGVTITYTDHDGDGLVSPGDEMSVEWGDYDGEEIDKMEIYDTWASQYSSESAAMPPVLPGFSAILGALGLLGAAIASRRD